MQRILKMHRIIGKKHNNCPVCCEEDSGEKEARRSTKEDFYWVCIETLSNYRRSNFS